MAVYDKNGNTISSAGSDNDTIFQTPNLPYHLATNIAKGTNKRPCCSALFITDPHGDSDRFKRFVSLANLGHDKNVYADNNRPFDVAICGGDIIHFSATESDASVFEGVAVGGISWYRNLISGIKLPFLVTTGNHDCGWTKTTASYTSEQMYNRYIKGTTLSNSDSLPYGYYDDTEHKVRFIVLYDYDSGIVEYALSQGATSLVAQRGFAKIYGQDQIDWLISTLNSVPEEYGVVIVGHTMQLYKNVEVVSGIEPPTLSARLSTIARESYAAQTRASGTTEGIIADIVQAFIDKTSLSATYTYSGNNWWSSSISIIPDVTVNADFSNANGVFMCYICGHFHSDGIFRCTTSGYTHQTMIMLTSASCEQAQHGDGIPRCVGSDTQDCLFAFTFDVAQRKVSVTKIGSSIGSDGVDRKQVIVDVS